MATGPTFIHNPHSPDVFADNATGFFTFNGCMRITFESLRSDYSDPASNINRVVIGRLVLPVAAAEAMAKGILDQIENLKKQEGSEQNATLQ